LSDPVSGAAAAKFAVDVVKVVPWGQLFIWFKAYFLSPRVSIIGSVRSGKTTFLRVVNNHGRLVPRGPHVRTKVSGGIGTTKMKVAGDWGESELLLSDIEDTPGDKGTADSVVDRLVSYTPKVLVVVVDVSRPFSYTEDPHLAESDTSLWFDAIRIQALKRQKEFQYAIGHLAAILVLMNQFDLAHAEVEAKTAAKPDDFMPELKRREKLYRDQIDLKLRGWFDVGARSLDEVRVEYFKCCLVKYPDKRVTEYDNGHIGIFQAVAEAVSTDALYRRTGVGG
jgi:signal recognition particle receptor subunit beta